MLNMALYKLQYLKNLLTREEGQDLVEYALLLGLISLVSIAALTSAGVQVGAIWTAIDTALQAAVTAV